MTVPTLSLCEVCGREVLAHGEYGRVEAAWDRNGNSQATAFWYARLRSRKAWEREDADDIAVRLDKFAQTGELEVPRELNDLDDGIREFKTEHSRYPFYEPSQPSCAIARITHGFGKRTGRTPQGRTTFKDLDLARAIRREDNKR